MNSLTRLNANLSDGLRYFQIDLQGLLSTLRVEASGIATGIPAEFKRYDEMAYGLLEMAIDGFGVQLGYRVDEPRYNQRMTRYYTLFDDLSEILQDATSTIHWAVMQATDKTVLEHRFSYQILVNGNLLVGLDPRDLVKMEIDNFVDPMLDIEEPTGGGWL